MSAFVPLARAQVASSTHFIIQEQTLLPGGESSSNHFLLRSIISPKVAGQSVSTGYDLFTGFEYYPFITTPIVQANAGSAQVSLTWTAADAAVGYIVGSYSVGQATVSGGPYSFSSVGNVLASTRTSLANGTPYYFVIRVNDALGNAIATSTEVSATPVAPSTPPSLGGGSGSSGGGGSGVSVSPTAPIPGSSTLTFFGHAYPGSVVTVLKDAQVAVTTIADTLSNFQVSVNSIASGNYFFSAYSEDNKGTRSSSVTFPVSIAAGASITIGGIFITPTIGVDKSEVKRGDTVVIFGQTTGLSAVTIQVNSDTPFFAKTQADKSGAYVYNFDTSPLEYGDHSTKSKSSINGEISSYSAAVAFQVGDQSVLKNLPVKAVSKGDENKDGRVNLVDYSIMAYWYKRANPPKSADFNNDGKVDLVDFSILAYNWTG